MNYKNIYIVLTLTRTFPARVIHLYTQEPYAHASLAFDEDLEEMYSFARKGIWNPFNAGFIREDINNGLFAKHQSTKCSIYSLKVSESQYINLREVIDVFKRNEDKYSYNYLGLLAASMNIPVQTREKYFCSQFVAYVLEYSGISIFDKGYECIKPRDIRVNSNLELLYQGKLSKYRSYKNKQLALQ